MEFDDGPYAFEGEITFDLEIEMFGHRTVRTAKVTYEHTPEWPYYDPATDSEVEGIGEARYELWLLAEPSDQVIFADELHGGPRADDRRYWAPSDLMEHTGVMSEEQCIGIWDAVERDARRQDQENRSRGAQRHRR